MDLQVEVDGLEDVLARLLKFEQAGRDVRPLLRRLGLRLHGELEKQFATEGGHASGGWAPLAESTLRRKLAMGYPPDILMGTGAMRRSFVDEASGHVHKVTADSVQVGSSVPYAKYHQHGTGKMPARRPAELNREFIRESVKRLQRYLVEGQL